MTFEDFQRDATWGRYKGRRRLVVQHGHSVYSFTQQRNGRLTATPDEVLRAVYDEQVKPAGSFFADLQRDLRLLEEQRQKNLEPQATP